MTGWALEVGSGLGYVIDYLSNSIPALQTDGLEISYVALERARSKFSEYNFFQGDITDADLTSTFSDGEVVGWGVYDVVILNQVLWYILHKLETVLNNCHRLLRDGGYLIVSQAFMRSKQRYGVDIVDGYDGFVQYMRALQECKHTFELVERHYDARTQFVHHDGLLLFKKCP